MQRSNLLGPKKVRGPNKIGDHFSTIWQKNTTANFFSDLPYETQLFLRLPLWKNSGWILPYFFQGGKSTHLFKAKNRVRLYLLKKDKRCTLCVFGTDASSLKKTTGGIFVQIRESCNAMYEIHFGRKKCIKCVKQKSHAMDIFFIMVYDHPNSYTARAPL